MAPRLTRAAGTSRAVRRTRAPDAGRRPAPCRRPRSPRDVHSATAAVLVSTTALNWMPRKPCAAVPVDDVRRERASYAASTGRGTDHEARRCRCAHPAPRGSGPMRRRAEHPPSSTVATTVRPGGSAIQSARPSSYRRRGVVGVGVARPHGGLEDRPDRGPVGLRRRTDLRTAHTSPGLRSVLQ